MMSEYDYLAVLKLVLTKGAKTPDRTGVGTLRLFGEQMRFDLRKGFPAVTTKKLFFDSVVDELLWFISGSTNVRDLDSKIWEAWADEEGSIGPGYGKQLRDWNGIDQLTQVIEDIKTNPYSRRHVVSFWNVEELDKMALVPCHYTFQFFVDNNELSCMLTQRSADMFLGVPFNIASYSLLTHMVAQECGLGVGEFIHNLGDAHIYLNHVDQVKEQLSRDVLDPPSLLLNPDVKKVVDFKKEDITLVDYNHHPALRAPVAV